MWVQVAGFLLLCLTAAFLSWPIWKAALRQRRRDRWPKVVGTVLEQRMTRAGNGITLDYLVRYEHGGETFTVLARDWSPGAYTGAAERHGGADFDRLMRERLDLHKVGGPIALMVNPDSPRRAFYKRGRTWPMTAIAVVVSAAFIALIAALTPVIFQQP
jgi:hypothetical protein